MTEIIDIQIPEIPFPLKLRDKTTDLANFHEVFFNEDYYMEFDFEPQFIIDCGAYIGLSSIYFKLQFPNSTIIAVEAAKSNFDLLKENLSFYSAAHCLNNAIWNVNEKRLLISDKYDLGQFGFIVSEVDNLKEGNVTSITIFNIMKRFNVSEIDLLKVDIEGSEIELFSNNYEYWLPRTKALIIETHDRFRNYSGEQTIKTLKLYNFLITQKGNLLYCINQNNTKV